MDFRGGTKINLHDGVLETVEVLWSEKLCKFVISPVSTEGKAICLQFFGVTEVHIPLADPWGPSNSILECEETQHSYVLAMQSGDTISITATEYEIQEL